MPVLASLLIIASPGTLVLEFSRDFISLVSLAPAWCFIKTVVVLCRFGRNRTTLLFLTAVISLLSSKRAVSVP